LDGEIYFNFGLLTLLIGANCLTIVYMRTYKERNRIGWPLQTAYVSLGQKH